MAGFITDKAAERRRKHRIAVIEQYKIGYLEPYCKAVKENDWENVNWWGTRCYDFRFGVSVADPNGRWSEKFNKAYCEVSEKYDI